MTFEQAWSKYIISLKGKEIYLAYGKKNTIIEVSDKGIKRITSNGNENFISIDVFEYTYNRVKNDGYISRKCINQEFPKRVSSGVIAILKEIHFIELTSNPELGLILSKTKQK